MILEDMFLAISLECHVRFKFCLKLLKLQREAYFMSTIIMLKSEFKCFVWYCYRQTEGQTPGQTDRHRETQTDIGQTQGQMDIHRDRQTRHSERHGQTWGQT